MNVVQAQGFEIALRSFTANCLRQPACPLGKGTVSAGITRLQGLLNQAASRPLISQIPGQPRTRRCCWAGWSRPCTASRSGST